jgi:hypothetical protein
MGWHGEWAGRHPKLWLWWPVHLQSGAWWRWASRARHPVDSLRWQWKWWMKPGIGEVVEDCRHQQLKVAAFGDTRDDLILEDGSHASWMHCCDHIPRKNREGRG